ncbi:MAG: sialidase family protein [Candidatus Polarisedimenticolia bacterium]
MTSRTFLCFAVLSILAPAHAPDPAAAPPGKPKAPVPVVFGTEVPVAAGRISLGAVEPSVAVNPKNPDNLVAAWIDFTNGDTNQCGFSFSNDGGRFWTFGGFLPTDGFSGDPSVTADADGNFYLTCFDFDTTLQRTTLRVARSTDGGRTFPTFSVPATGGSPDKELIAADISRRSRFRGTLYLAYTANRDGAFEIQVVVSRDRGLTWSAPVTIERSLSFSDNLLFGALPVLASDGTAYVFYSRFDYGTGPTDIAFSKSTDGGRIWNATADVATDLPSPGLFRLKNDSPQFGKQPFYGQTAGATFPTATVAPDGTVYVAWSDVPAGSCIYFDGAEPSCTNSDVRLSRSTDGGRTWSAPVKATDETGPSDQFFPALAAHADGLVSLSFWDKRLDPENEGWDAFYTNTRDGASFLANVRLSATTSTAGAFFVGDYAWMAVAGDAPVPVWISERDGKRDIFAARGTPVR